MMYQLPSGKVIQITLEQYLEMTDEDIQYMVSINYGDYIRNPFYGSATRAKAKKKKVEEDPEDIDTGIDFVNEDEDQSHGSNVVEEVPIDELPDIPDPGTEEN